MKITVRKEKKRNKPRTTNKKIRNETGKREMSVLVGGKMNASEFQFNCIPEESIRIHRNTKCYVLGFRGRTNLSPTTEYSLEKSGFT